MNNDFYGGEPTIDEQIKKQNKPSFLRSNSIFVILIVIILILIVLFFVFNFNKTIEYETKDNNSYLKSLEVSGANLNKKFNKEDYRYSITTDKDLISFTCELDSPKSKLSGCTEIDLKNLDKITHQITVVAEDESVTIYYIIINKTKEELVSVDSVSGVPEDWVTADVTITASASAKAGLHASPYSFDEAKTWTSNNKHTVSSNGTVKIVARDIHGNLSKVKEVYIGKIDKSSPSVSLSARLNTSVATLLANVTPSSTTSGYTFTWYRNNEVMPGHGGATVTVRESGIYHVVVTTGTKRTAMSNNYQVNLR